MFFANCKTAEEVKETYRQLAFKFHPDVSSEENATEIFQRINSEYQTAWERLKRIHADTMSEEVGKTYEKDTDETASEFIGIINHLVSIGDDISVELVGRWLWITGNTKAHASELKACGCKYAPKKQAWSWHYGQDACRHSGADLATLRSYYGSKRYNSKIEQELIEA